MNEATRVLSLQTPLLGHAPYGEMLRRLLAQDTTLVVRSVWGDADRRRQEHTVLGRLVHRSCFTYSRNPAVRIRNADLYPLRYELGASYWALRLAERERRTFRPDVLHFHTQGLALLAAGLMKAYPTVISADTTSLLAQDLTLPQWRATFRLQQAIEGIAFRSAAAVVAWSQHAARSIVRDHRVASDRVEVIPPGVDVPQFADIGLGRYATARQVRRILFIGGEFERKGGTALVRVFLTRFAARGDVELHIVSNTRATIPAHPRIIVHAGVTAYSPAWRTLYDRADVFVMPTRHEAYGLVYLEAAAARLPVIAADAGAARELVVDGNTGFVVDPYDERALGDRIDRVLTDDALARRMGRAGRERVEREFDARAGAQRLAAVFARVARDGVAPRAQR